MTKFIQCRVIDSKPAVSADKPRRAEVAMVTRRKRSHEDSAVRTWVAQMYQIPQNAIDPQLNTLA